MPSEDRRVVSKQLPATSKNNALVTDGWKPSERAMVAAALGKVFDIQKAFGKTAGQLHTIIEAFCWGLRKYRADRVVWALGEYMLRKPDMPTPYDIRQIIDPIPEPPKFDKAYYVRLMKLREEQGKYALNDEEEQYVRDYEEHVRIQRPQ